jgi:hypothetical protein
MARDETSIYGWNFSYPSKMSIFIQKRAIPSLDFVAIPRFHPLKKG